MKKMKLSPSSPDQFSQEDHRWMKRAISLAEKARFCAPPNPWVGCVLVKNGFLIGEGSTASFGGSHAEVAALESRQADVKGATAYVTLEPCCHRGKTGPCTQALIEAGISRVVIALKDPDDKVAGKGIQQLQGAGIRVDDGLCEDLVEQQLASYLFHRRYHRPLCIIKAALSLDGAIAANDGTSKWISSPKAREHLHRLRAHCQAIAVGAATQQRDVPQLTVRLADLTVPQPLRLIFTASGDLMAKGPLFSDEHVAKTLILTTDKARASQIESWVEAGADYVILPEHQIFGGIDLEAAMGYLADRGVLQLLIEGGGGLASSFFRAGLCHRLQLYHGNCLLGAFAKPFFIEEIKTITNAPRFSLLELTALDDTISSYWSLKPS